MLKKILLRKLIHRTGYIDDGKAENPNREWQDFLKMRQSRKMPPLLGLKGQ